MCKKKIRKVIIVCLMVLFVPYVITVLAQGKIEKEKTGEFEEYCILQLAQEAHEEYEDEMIKAQTVILRTSIYKEIEETGKLPEQENIKISREYKNRLARLWKETEGEVILYDNALALTPFHRLSCGKTRDGKDILGEEYTYLKSVPCPKDIESEEQVCSKLISLNNAKIISKDDAGYVLEIKLGDEVCSGEDFREIYDIPSACFTLQKGERVIRVTSKGIGHGLGMSQYTANEMAKEGKTYIEILEYFFAETKIEKLE